MTLVKKRKWAWEMASAYGYAPGSVMRLPFCCALLRARGLTYRDIGACLFLAQCEVEAMRARAIAMYGKAFFVKLASDDNPPKKIVYDNIRPVDAKTQYEALGALGIILNMQEAQ